MSLSEGDTLPDATLVRMGADVSGGEPLLAAL